MSAGNFKNVPSDLIGLHHHPVAAAEPRVGAIGVDDAAVDHRRIEMSRIEQRVATRDGGRGLAMGAGDRRRSSSAASVRRASRRAAPPECAGRVLPSSSGLSRLIAVETTTHLGARRPFSALWPTVTLTPFSRSRLTLALVGRIRALHGVAEIAQHLGDAAHADAADTDESEWVRSRGAISWMRLVCCRLCAVKSAKARFHQMPPAIHVLFC